MNEIVCIPVRHANGELVYVPATEYRTNPVPGTYVDWSQGREFVKVLRTQRHQPVPAKSFERVVQTETGRVKSSGANGGVSWVEQIDEVSPDDYERLRQSCERLGRAFRRAHDNNWLFYYGVPRWK